MYTVEVVSTARTFPWDQEPFEEPGTKADCLLWSSVTVVCNV